MLFSVSAEALDYDKADFYTTASAFSYFTKAADVTPCLLLAALIVKDRPLSSFFLLLEDGDGSYV